MSAPRTTVHVQRDAVDITDGTGRVVVAPPSGEITLNFSVEDHQSAYDVLESLVGEILIDLGRIAKERE